MTHIRGFESRLKKIIARYLEGHERGSISTENAIEAVRLALPQASVTDDHALADMIAHAAIRRGISVHFSGPPD
jgi:LDH2 family malate/lactate/ureidoglycolate dehydrogenase